MVKFTENTSKSEHMKSLLQQSIKLLGQACLMYESHLKVEGLLVFTLDDEDVLVVNINEQIHVDENVPDSELQAVMSSDSKTSEERTTPHKHHMSTRKTVSPKRDPLGKYITITPRSTPGKTYKGFKRTGKRRITPQKAETPSKFPKQVKRSPTTKDEIYNDTEQELDHATQNMAEQIIQEQFANKSDDALDLQEGSDEVDQLHEIKKELDEDGDHDEFPVSPNQSDVLLGDDADIADNIYKKGNKWCCSFCDKAYTARCMARLHIKEIHQDSEVYKCGLCGYKSKRKGTVKMHVKEVHERSEPYQCPYCDYSIKWERSLRRHIKNIHGEELYSCTKCRTKKATQEDLEKHMEEEH